MLPYKSESMKKDTIGVIGIDGAEITNETSEGDERMDVKLRCNVVCSFLTTMGCGIGTVLERSGILAAGARWGC